MMDVTRRDFAKQAMGGAAMTAVLARMASGAPDENESNIGSRPLADLPNFCSHEHWGSISSIGMASGGYRADTEAGATPSRRTTIWDLVLDPYLTSWIESTGFSPQTRAKEAGAADFAAWWEQNPAEAFRAVRPHLERQMLSGTFQCVRRGVLFLYEIDVASLDLEEWKQVDRAVGEHYTDMFSWYRTAMEKVGFSELIRPVHPEFFLQRQEEQTAEAELAFTHTIMRIDPFVDLWQEKSNRRKTLSSLCGIEPRDAASWREFLGRYFDIAAENGTTGIKQLQAYSRNLDFSVREDSDVIWSGDLNWEQKMVFKDWVMNECCKQAHERGWPHQIHVGTHNLRHSSPLPLEDLAKRYPNMKIVMLHCWPFIVESGWLAKHRPNVYIDTCWAPVLNPAFYRRQLAEWVNYVPTHKILCAHDSTSIEMAIGSSLFTREILSETLSAAIGGLGLEPSHLERIAKDMLHNNAVSVYGIGTPA